ncbi:MAG: hypothetical protein U9Q67_04625 [Patescibacteria group bacterium]|nr:hypothetical protein [Patescibacteria group bacterium]
MPKPELEETTYRERLDAGADQWGQACVTATEMDVIYDMRKKLGSWQRVQQLLFQGEIEPPTDVDEDTFIDSAIQHACPRGYPIYHSPKRTLEGAIWSYTMKNRAYRFFARYIHDQDHNGNLLSAWRGSERKEEDEVGVIPLIRPEGIPNNILVGIEKPECYLPCQLLRVLEALRTGRENLSTPVTRQIISLSDAERALLKIPWREYQDAINESRSLTDLAANIAFKTFSTLNERGLDQEKILAIIFQGFRPHGTLLEHGQLDKLLGIWLTTAFKIDGCYFTNMWDRTRQIFEDAVAKYNAKTWLVDVPPLSTTE